jgi:hypothetical protein
MSGGGGECASAAAAKHIRREHHATTAATQLGQIQKTCQKEIQKNREIVGSYLCLQRFDKF